MAFQDKRGVLFEPDDRLMVARLQQMHHPDGPVPNTDLRVAGAAADGLLHERDHLVNEPGEELAPAQTIKCRNQIGVRRERRFVFYRASSQRFCARSTWPLT